MAYKYRNLFVGANTWKELRNDYIMGYIVDFIFRYEMLADDKKISLVKYVYTYQEAKKLIQEEKIEYKKEMLEPKSIFYKPRKIDKIVGNIGLIDKLL